MVPLSRVAPGLGPMTSVCLLAGFFFFLTPSGAAAQISVSGYTQPRAKTTPAPPLAERARDGQAPKIHAHPELRLEALKRFRLPPLGESEMRQQAADKRLRVGAVRALPQPLDVRREASEFTLAEGRLRALRVQAEGALQVRLNFARLELDEGERLFVYVADNPQLFCGPYTRQDGREDFWTPPLDGDEVVIEIFSPAGAPEKTAAPGPAGAARHVTVSAVSHVFRRPRAAGPPAVLEGAQDEAAGACNLDVPAEWSEAAKSVGLLQFTKPDGEYLCSGVLLADAQKSGTPYLLTANHCIGTQAEAGNLAVYWLYDTPGARGSGQSQWRSTLLETSQATDFTLIKLRNPVPAGVRFSGWTTEPPAPGATLTGIHHPQGDYKRISFARLSDEACPPGFPPELCDDFHKVRWTGGVVEPGSSGSGLWVGPASDPKLVGQLLGGVSECGGESGPDIYGRFDRSFEAVAYHLTKQGCAYAVSNSEHVAEAGGGAGRAQLFVREGEACAWTARSLSPWIKLTAASGQGDGTASYTVEPNPNPARRLGQVVVAGKTVLVVQKGSGESCAPKSIALGETVSGTLAEGSCRSPITPQGYAARYTFTAEKGRNIGVTLTSRAFDTYLILYGPDGEIIAENDDDGPNSTNSRLAGYYQGRLGIPETGTYTIEVIAFDAGATGAYTLKLEKGCLFRVTAGTTKFSAFGSPSGLGGDAAIFEVEATSCDGLPAVPDGFYAHGSDFDWMGVESGYNYGYLNSGKGRYYFSPRSRNDGPPRRGVLTVAGVSFVIEQAAFCGARHSVTVTPSATVASIGGVGRAQVKVADGAFCTWQADNNSFPSWVTLNGLTIGTGDGELSYQVWEHRGLVPRSTTLTIVGQPHLITQQPPGGACVPTPLVLNQIIEGRLESSDCLPGTFENYRVDRYTFTAAAGQQIAVTLGSPDFEAHFIIYRQDGTQVTGGNVFKPLPPLPPVTEARFPAEGFMELPADDTYVLVVGHHAQQQGGRYKLKLEMAGAPGCVFRINNDRHEFAAAGGDVPVTLTATGGCEWSLTNKPDWITFPQGETGRDTKEIVIRAAPNAGAPRQANLYLGGRRFFVWQDAPCSYVNVKLPAGPGANRLYLPPHASSLALEVVTGRTCALTGGSNVAWLSFTGYVPLSAYLRYEANTGGLRRGELNLGGKVIEVVQGATNLTTVSAANYATVVARDGIVSLFGEDLTSQTVSATSLPLPDYLGGVRILLDDQKGQFINPPLFYVSPTQINFQIPSYLRAGEVKVLVTGDAGRYSTGLLTLADVAPSVFTANQDGAGVPAALLQRVKADGTQQYEEVFEPDGAGKFRPRAINLGPNDEAVYLLLFGTGIRLRSDLKNVTCQVGSEALPVAYAGAQGGYVGLDQVNVLLPKSLHGRGEVSVTLSVDGKAANTVKLRFAP
jgi:uncharacterized protein (TIGR03437 family)